MKKVLLILLAGIAVLFFIYSRNNSAAMIASNFIDRADLAAGELRYRVYLLGILPIGDAVFNSNKIEDYEGRKVYHLSAKAKSLKFFSKFFKGQVVLDSYVDTATLNPLVFKERISINDKPDIYKEVFYDQEGGIMTIGTVERQIPANTQDPLSAFFALRKTDFTKTQDFDINLNSNQKNYALKGKATEKDLTIDRKVHKVIYADAQIFRRDKNPYHKTNISMVLLKDKGNLPVMIKIFTSGILINARLVDIKNGN